MSRDTRVRKLIGRSGPPELQEELEAAWMLLPEWQQALITERVEECRRSPEWSIGYELGIIAACMVADPPDTASGGE
jgi:hypothetical protein